jgi:hypothetical protein
MFTEIGCARGVLVSTPNQISETCEYAASGITRLPLHNRFGSHQIKNLRPVKCCLRYNQVTSAYHNNKFRSVAGVETVDPDGMFPHANQVCDGVKM